MNQTLERIIEHPIGKGLLTATTIYFYQETFHFLDYDFKPNHYFTGFVGIGITIMDYLNKQQQDRYKRRRKQ